eukprot:770291-Rhodomonas_salina.1
MQSGNGVQLCTLGRCTGQLCTLGRCTGLPLSLSSSPLLSPHACGCENQSADVESVVCRLWQCKLWRASCCIAAPPSSSPTTGP